MSQRRGPNASQHPSMMRGVKDMSVHQAPHGGEGPTNVPVRGCLGADRDTRLTLNARKHGREDLQAVASQGYNPHRGRCHDSSKNLSPSPDPLGPRVFSSRIRNAAFLPWYHPQMNITKYTVETNPGIWLEDYRLACSSLEP
jgi:hypothetical protein